jgi:glutathione S-transferase
MATITVYGAPQSTFTRAVRMACHEKGVDHELVLTRPGAANAFNPFGKIPAIRHGDLTLYETAAILRYLDRSFAGPRLWPDDPRAAAIVDQWIGAIGDSLRNSAQLYMAARYNLAPAPAEMVQRYLDKTRAVLPAFDRQLGQTRYLASDRFTAADILFAPFYFYFPAIPELKAIADAAPNCQRWGREMASRPSVTATEPEMKLALAN